MGQLFASSLVFPPITACLIFIEIAAVVDTSPSSTFGFEY